MLASSSLAEEGIEGFITTVRFVRRHLTIRLYPMFQAVQLPATIAHLDTCLANMDADTLTLWNIWTT